jgi:hypothetical protein
LAAGSAGFFVAGVVGFSFLGGTCFGGSAVEHAEIKAQAMTSDKPYDNHFFMNIPPIY